MPYINLKRAFMLFCLIGCSLAARANEGAATEAPKDQREFSEKSAKLSALQNRIEEADKKFKELVREKAEAKTSMEKQAVIKQMVEITKQRNADAGVLNKLKTDLSYRYPDQGDRLNKTYQTQDKRSVEEMEGAAGLDEMLTRTKKQVDKKFAPFMPDNEKVEAKAKAKSTEKEKPARLKLEK